MNSPSNSPLSGSSDERPDLLTPVAFTLYAERNGTDWVEIAGGGQKRH